MLSLNIAFWMFILIFALIGAMRGWAKELLVIFAVVTAVFMTYILEHHVPFVRDSQLFESETSLFWLRTSILTAMVFFGYSTPSIPKLSEISRFSQHSLESAMLGFFLGILNGYMIIGTLWSYLDSAGYPFDIVSAPIAGTAAGDISLRMIPWFLPAWLTPPLIYFAIAGALAIVIMLFL
jgi:uncharacterized membrane protein required for colicin V production